MEGDELPAVNPDVDHTQILPIQQKRTIAFVNQFILSTVSYLNEFAQSCESRFMEFEYKLQKVEASLLILESQLSSIDGLEEHLLNLSVKKESLGVEENSGNSALELPTVTQSEPTTEEKEDEQSFTEQNVSDKLGIKACDHPNYKKFFKMIQFGVPEQAVKIKMQTDGLDPEILNKPNEILSAPPVDDNESSASSSC